MRKFVLLALLLSAACDREATKTDASPPMASAAAAVPAPPSGASPEQVSPAPLALQDITMADIEKYDLSGMGCVFVPQGAKEAVVLLEDHESQLKIADALVRLPAAKDSTGTRLPARGTGTPTAG